MASFLPAKRWRGVHHARADNENSDGAETVAHVEVGVGGESGGEPHFNARAPPTRWLASAARTRMPRCFRYAGGGASGKPELFRLVGARLSVQRMRPRMRRLGRGER